LWSVSVRISSEHLEVLKVDSLVLKVQQLVDGNSIVNLTIRVDLSTDDLISVQSVSLNVVLIHLVVGDLVVVSSSV
jgi:hypothetical protein